MINKWINGLTAALLMFLLTACSAENGSIGEWSRMGNYTDGNSNFLSITTAKETSADENEYEGYYVNVFIEGTTYGWFIPQEGNTLHGNLMPEFEEETFIVTVSEEGKDGLLLTLENGNTYHFKPVSQ